MECRNVLLGAKWCIWQQPPVSNRRKERECMEARRLLQKKKKTTYFRDIRGFDKLIRLGNQFRRHAYSFLKR